MRIEMMLPALPAAGMEMVVAQLTRGLSRRGHDVGVTCIIAKGLLADSLEREGHTVTLVPTPGLRTNLLPQRLSRWLRDRRPDVVHIHSGAWLKSARAAMLARVPRIVFTMHGFDGLQAWYEPLLDRWAARYTGVTVAVSEALLPYLSRTVGIEPARLRVITNGVDTRLYSPGPRTGRVRERFALNDDDVVIGHVARFSPVKNHALLLNAFRLVLNESPGAFLALVGDGPLRGDIEAQVSQLGIGERVGFLGRMTDLPTVYRDFDVLVLSSFSEATPMSILEAMSSGLPVVATSVGGTPPLLADGDAGLLVRSDDALALSAALLRLSRAPDERARFGRLARQRAVSLYSEDRMIDSYLRVYEGARDVE